MGALLEVQNLRKFFQSRKGLFFGKTEWLRAVDGISFEIHEHENLGLVGESGCGKSTTAKCILRLVEPDDGTIIFDGVDILSLKESELLKVRRNMQMIFQDPTASLNPRKTLFHILSRPFIVSGMTKNMHGNLEDKLSDLLETVGLSPGHLYVDRYPHELSVGQRQRVGIARALALNPSLVVADEPVASLDVSVRVQILNLMKKLRKKFETAFLYITHDLDTIRSVCDRVAVMYLGKIVEISPVRDLFTNPLHPYTEALLTALPIPDPVRARRKKRIILEGEVPSPINLPSGCRFHTRCPVAKEGCTEREPELIEYEKNHWAACICLGD